jgi:hypothetical protein
MFGSNAKFGFGGSAAGYIRVLNKANGGIRIYVAYDWFKNHDLANDDAKFFPVRIGYQHFLYQNAIFLFADAGIMRHMFSSGTYSGFCYGIGGGYNIDLQQKNFVQISAYYNHPQFTYSDQYSNTEVLNYSYFTIRIAYGLEFGKKKGRN